ncbi:M50 family metallopeptidase [Candidatus Micrarchaeota archaeon]|nr:M50 family metallopeptidase [Candidatus Micrarchaeota archaeon]
MVTIGSGFILHEMGHKLLAIYYGSRARFIMWTQGIVFMFVTSLLGFLFAAPGAVYIYNENIKPKQNAAISLIGPGINLIIAVFFIFLSIIAPISLHFSFLKHNLPGFGIRNGLVFVWEFGAALNLMLALFNMIPATPLDGSKVFRYSKLIWFGAILILLAAAYVVIGIEAVISWSIMLALAVVLSKLAFG